MERLAECIRDDLGVVLDVEAPGTGAAGGLAAGLFGFAGAALESGAEYFLRLAEIPELLRPASGEGIDGVLTGEGSYDSQSGEGKLTGELAELCGRSGTPLAVIAGSATRQQGSA